jgi:hypothetical protein
MREYLNKLAPKLLCIVKTVNYRRLLMSPASYLLGSWGRISPSGMDDCLL